MGLDLYSKVEPYLDFEDEVYFLHKEFMRFIMENEIDDIIDIGCGQGYFLENLKINGKKSYGIDLSQKQIKVCEEKGLNAQAKPLSKVTEKFSCATAIFDVLNYISPKDLETFLKEVSQVLSDEAYFIFDVNSYFGFDEVAQGTISMDLDDKFICIDANFEDEKLRTDITLFEKQENEVYSKQSDFIIQHYHKTNFLEELLKKEGFEVKQIKNFNLHSDEEADKYIFICKKTNKN